MYRLDSISYLYFKQAMSRMYRLDSISYLYFKQAISRMYHLSRLNLTAFHLKKKQKNIGTKREIACQVHFFE